MHVSHKPLNADPNSKIKAAVIAVFFSVEDYDHSIDESHNQTLQLFFDELKLNNFYSSDKSDAGYIDYGLDQLDFVEAMDVFDFNDRWVYLGCDTLPPCTQLIYWNVLRKVYPIELK